MGPFVLQEEVLDLLPVAPLDFLLAGPEHEGVLGERAIALPIPQPYDEAIWLGCRYGEGDPVELSVILPESDPGLRQEGQYPPRPLRPVSSVDSIGDGLQLRVWRSGVHRVQYLHGADVLQQNKIALLLSCHQDLGIPQRPNDIAHHARRYLDSM